MENIVFLIFRRMRAPLLMLVLSYSIAVLGLVLIPGKDADGNVWHMDFFHAFYFVSFMASTIGFGEIPFEFTAAQRLWVTFSIFFPVVVWLYSIGTVLVSFCQGLHQRLAGLTITTDQVEVLPQTPDLAGKSAFRQGMLKGLIL